MTCARVIQSFRLRAFGNISKPFPPNSTGSRRSGTDKRVIDLAARWVLDRYDASVALWGARRPDQLEPINEVMGWHIDGSAMADIDRILAQTVKDPVGPEFMAPPVAFAA